MVGIRSHSNEFGPEIKTVSTEEENIQHQVTGLLHGLPVAYLTEGKFFR